MPLILVHFFNYALQAYPINNVSIEVLLLTLVASTPILNTFTRILCDAQLKKKMMCGYKKKSVQQEDDLSQALMDD